MVPALHFGFSMLRVAMALPQSFQNEACQSRFDNIALRHHIIRCHMPQSAARKIWDASVVSTFFHWLLDRTQLGLVSSFVFIPQCVQHTSEFRCVMVRIFQKLDK